MVLDILRPCTKILFGKKQKYNPTSGNCKKKKMAEEQYTLRRYFLLLSLPGCFSVSFIYLYFENVT